MNHQAQTAQPPQVADVPVQRHRRHLQCQASRGTVHIGCAPAVRLFIRPRVMEQSLASAMKLTVHVHEGETGYLLQCLRERSLDLVICRSQLAAPELQNQEVMNKPLRVALPPQHPLCRQTQIALEALRAERFLLHSALLGAGISDMLLRACQEAGFTPEVADWGVETLPMLLMVQKGLGVAFAPDSFAQLCVQGLPVLVPLADATEHALAALPCAAPGGGAAQGTHPGAMPAAAHLRTGQGLCAGAWGPNPSP